MCRPLKYVSLNDFHDLFREPVARANGCAVVRTYTGHGVNDLFHDTPNIPHYAKNKAVGTMKAGMVSRCSCACRSLTNLLLLQVFTIEPVRFFFPKYFSCLC